jgi:hypothetical protein
VRGAYAIVLESFRWNPAVLPRTARKSGLKTGHLQKSENLSKVPAAQLNEKETASKWQTK